MGAYNPGVPRGTLGPYPDFISGDILRLAPFGFTTVVAKAAGNIDLQPLDLAESLLIDRILIELTTAGVAGALARAGIYADDGTRRKPTGLPMVDAGTLAADGAVGILPFVVNLRVGPGRIWVAGGPQIQTSTYRVNAGSGNIVQPGTVNLVSMGFTITALGALPDLTGVPIGGGLNLNSFPAAMGLRIA